MHALHINPRTAFGILIYQAHSLPDVWHNYKLLYTNLIVSASPTQLEQHTNIGGGVREELHPPKGWQGCAQSVW